MSTARKRAFKCTDPIKKEERAKLFFLENAQWVSQKKKRQMEMMEQNDFGNILSKKQIVLIKNKL